MKKDMTNYTDKTAGSIHMYVQCTCVYVLVAITTTTIIPKDRIGTIIIMIIIPVGKQHTQYTNVISYYSLSTFRLIIDNCVNTIANRNL